MADGFLARWSRRKSGHAEPIDAGAAPDRAGAADADAFAPAPAGTGTPEPAQAAASPAAAGIAPTGAAGAGGAGPFRPRAFAAAEPALTLDDVARLTPSADFSRFVARSVDPAVRNAALKKLFADPRFNVMDGLDTYIADYGKPDPDSGGDAAHG